MRLYNLTGLAAECPLDEMNRLWVGSARRWNRSTRAVSAAYPAQRLSQRHGGL